MLISQSEAGRIINVTKAAIGKLKNKNPMPSFFVKDEKDKWKVDDENEEWKLKVEKAKNKSDGKKSADKKKSDSQKKKLSKEKNKIETLDNKIKDIEKDKQNQKQDQVDDLNPEYVELARKAQKAELETLIYNAKIKEEKSKQEEIKTLEVKRDLAPIYLVKHFFDFADNLIQRIYRKPNELEPQLAALFLQKKNKDATALLVREFENLVIDCQRDLIKAIEEEGFEIKKIEGNQQ